MKKSPTVVNRGKPPSIRTPYLSSKSRSHLHVDRPPFHLPSLQLGPERLNSMSENPEIYEVSDKVSAMNFSSKEVSDCMTNWIAFLKVLQTLCATGSELTESINALGCGSTACKSRADHCKSMWDHLYCATNAAAAIVKNQTVASLQEVHLAPDIDSDQTETNQAVVCSGLVRLVNLQYQFSVACCEWIVGISGCQCCPPHSERECDAVARCFAPRPNPALPLQRRWSEVAAHTEGKLQDPTLRRWSIPWKLALPTSNTAERSRSVTPDAVWHTALASQEDLQDVITLLSCRPSNTNTQHLPGVVLTKAEGQPHDPGSHRGSISSHRGSWWGEGDELDVAHLTSRKSSSSTDSSSCYSLHSRSTSGSEELSHGQRSHLYSMWSGTDLPCIKLPESSENNDT